jgi:hypothetical protein
MEHNELTTNLNEDKVKQNLGESNLKSVENSV